uniref:Uncharacterized protein n=1 Tax=Anopheles minimus TaxID=112268 RepID=A0A182VQS5_9DIPT
MAGCGQVNDDLYRREMISDTPPGGAPLPRFARMACTAPAHAPRFPSQYSGFGSNFSSVSNAFAAIQNSPTL